MKVDREAFLDRLHHDGVDNPTLEFSRDPRSVDGLELSAGEALHRDTSRVDQSHPSSSR